MLNFPRKVQQFRVPFLVLVSSDQWSFWQHGYPGLMVTDTAPYRYPYYHTAQDTPDKVDWERTTKVIAGLEKVVADLVGVDIN